MTWLKIDNPEIDGAKRQAEIDAEIARLKEEKKLPPMGITPAKR